MKLHTFLGMKLHTYLGMKLHTRVWNFLPECKTSFEKPTSVSSDWSQLQTYSRTWSRGWSRACCRVACRPRTDRVSTFRAKFWTRFFFRIWPIRFQWSDFSEAFQVGRPLEQSREDKKKQQKIKFTFFSEEKLKQWTRVNCALSKRCQSKKNNVHIILLI
jgi:hypothetical protein